MNTINDLTVFQQSSYTLSGLLNYIDMGDVGLPEIQRPFVWKATKVRDLLDSMFRGFPVGYLLFWVNAEVNHSHPIGLNDKAHKTSRLLVIDGQQRLTALYSVFRNKPVLDRNYHESHIEIAFRPRDAKFEVADAAIRRDPEYVANISELWASGRGPYLLTNSFLEQLRAKHSVTVEECNTISNNLNRLIGLMNYPFTVLEIASSVDEEQVADIFVRINSQGVTLKQADFILTLLSVFWDDGRKNLEQFSRDSRIPSRAQSKPSPYNTFIEPDPDQLLRVAVAIGFNRGRLRSVYQLLRGRDLETGTYSPELRDRQFATLRDAQEKVLNLTNWQQFFGSLIGAGYRIKEMVSSQNALLNAYAFYLIGKTRYGMAEHDLQCLIGRWFFATSITSRYTTSSETTLEADLARIKDCNDSGAFSHILNTLMEQSLTNDFWNITLPLALKTSSAQSAALTAYFAALNILDAPVLFSNKKIAAMLDPLQRMKKKALDRHHLFPRAWLEREGIKEMRAINQIGNMALLEWPDNINISDSPPVDYLPKMRSRFTSESWAKMCEMHGLPDGWETMPYDEFLQQRRRLMAYITRRGYEALLPIKV